MNASLINFLPSQETNDRINRLAEIYTPTRENVGARRLGVSLIHTTPASGCSKFTSQIWEVLNIVV